ncbi:MULTISPECIES: tautomerase family protein [Sphingobium]|jgi:4-oxalocrotonate tautomerase|uniref:Tautomerase n=1 Tax=Sphingobium yanoikuyae TaxID=13690 RepID=A0A0J9FRY1_SPHYA|nr:MULTISPECIES: 4-oxalocrotonate tautomerase family protein [Sphingobium]ATI79059.1 isomerase [Sphingobium yanoikuyae]ATP18728.1 isomerase [Sphingobium yanoikuyae]KMW31010.1 isomerase [Sphingobium yanoikuyae]MBR2268383.1 4-oxalocrotonate tautomerase family protein [Sphingobium sp.]NBB38969.1 2-hydroxymuconate tautomerase family protein [Sphingobium yanoikuyae]
MPFVDIRLAGSATREQKAAIVADVTQSLVERLGKPAAAVQIVISEVSTENYAAGGQLIADRAISPNREDANAADTPR